MSRPISPMLAVTAANVRWTPDGFWAMPKYDGLRCIIDPTTGPVLRSGSPVPCPAVREALSDRRLIGLDGELTAPGGLEAAQSAFTGHAAPPPGWRFTAFDDLSAFSLPFSDRLARLRSKADNLPDFATVSPARFAAGPDDAPGVFADVVCDQLAQDPCRSLDGLILRSPAWPYREGKASAHRGELLKVKPMSEGEMPILDIAARSDDAGALGAVRLACAGRSVWAPVGMRRGDARLLWTCRDSLIDAPAVIRWWGRTTAGSLRNPVMVAIRRDLAW